MFLIWPEIDTYVASLFYDFNEHVFLGDKFYVLYIVYKVFAYIHVPLLIALIAYSIYCQHAKLFDHKRRALFLLCALLLGPGLFVNVTLKDNSIGRARPEQTVAFGGEARFTSAFEYSGECEKNCSFTSGHASIGFVLIAAAWAARRRYYFIAGCILGGLLGVVRIAQGAHFLSDVLFSFWAVYLVSLFLARCFNLTIKQRTVAGVQQAAA
jgi:lipid A 4'-phosphatase